MRTVQRSLILRYLNEYLVPRELILLAPYRVVNADWEPYNVTTRDRGGMTGALYSILINQRGKFWLWKWTQRLEAKLHGDMIIASAHRRYYPDIEVLVGRTSHITRLWAGLPIGHPLWTPPAPERILKLVA